MVRLSTGPLAKRLFSAAISRKMPVTLPHKLIPYLLEHGLMPKISEEEIQHFWRHMSEHVSWARAHTSRHGMSHMPLFLWGDDAQYTENHEALVCVTLGCTLDPSRNTWRSVWPLFCFKDVTRLMILCHNCFMPPLGFCLPTQVERAGFDTLQAFLKPAPCLRDYCTLSFSSFWTSLRALHIA